MTLRMGKMLEARTAPGNQQRTAAKKERERRQREGGDGGGRDVIWCSRGEEKKAKGESKRKGGVAAVSAGMKEVMSM